MTLNARVLKQAVIVLFFLLGLIMYQKWKNSKPHFFPFFIHTCDEFQPNPQENTQPESLWVTEKAGILVAGSYENNKKYSWLVRQSLDHGKSWKTVDQFSFANAFYTNAKKIFELPEKNNLIVEGYAQVEKEEKSYWIKRMSHDRGQT